MFHVIYMRRQLQYVQWDCNSICTYYSLQYNTLCSSLYVPVVHFSHVKRYKIANLILSTGIMNKGSLVCGGICAIVGIIVLVLIYICLEAFGYLWELYIYNVKHYNMTCGNLTEIRCCFYWAGLCRNDYLIIWNLWTLTREYLKMLALKGCV